MLTSTLSSKTTRQNRSFLETHPISLFMYWCRSASRLQEFSNSRTAPFLFRIARSAIMSPFKHVVYYSSLAKRWKSVTVCRRGSSNRRYGTLRWTLRVIEWSGSKLSGFLIYAIVTDDSSWYYTLMLKTRTRAVIPLSTVITSASASVIGTSTVSMLSWPPLMISFSSPSMFSLKMAFCSEYKRLP